MNMDAISGEGRRLLGRFLWHCAERQGIASQRLLAEWISERSRFEVPESKVNSIIEGYWKRSFDFNHLFAILDSAILTFPPEVEGGRPLEYADVMDILRGRLDPFTGDRSGQNSSNGAGIA